MPIISEKNRHLIEFTIGFYYSDLSDMATRCLVRYGWNSPDFFIDINNHAIKTLIENRDQRLFDILRDVSREAECALQEQLVKDQLEVDEAKAEHDQLMRNVKPQRSKRPGYVYLAKADQFYKIGYSKQPDRRYSQIGLQLPYPYELLHLIKVSDMPEAERELHSKYADRRTNGEWFSLSDEEVAEIMSIKSL